MHIRPSSQNKEINNKCAQKIIDTMVGYMETLQHQPMLGQSGNDHELYCWLQDMITSIRALLRYNNGPVNAEKLFSLIVDVS